MRTDVHHHILPPAYLSMLEKIGVTKALGVPFPKWSPERSLRFMKKNNIDKAVVSISSPGIYFKDDDFTIKLARFCNEYTAELKKKFPGTFGGFASLPLPNVNASLNELEFALDELNLDGICLMTNYNGKYLGDDSFDIIFDEINKREAVVFIHPTDPAEIYDKELGIPNALIEAPFETTRAVCHLIYKGITDRYQQIKFILSHGGGTIPYLAWRMALIKYAQENRKPPLLNALYDFIIKGNPDTGLNLLRSMYYDTALTSCPYALKALQEFVGPWKIVFGSDFPFANVASVVTKNLSRYNNFSDEDFKLIDNKNCCELFPGLSVN